MAQLCSEPGCDRKAAARGMCHRHYLRWWRDTPSGRQSEAKRRKGTRRTWGIWDAGGLAMVARVKRLGFAECLRRSQLQAVAQGPTPKAVEDESQGAVVGVAVDPGVVAGKHGTGIGTADGEL